MIPITIGIADDHLLVIQGIKAMLSKKNHLSIVFAAENGNSLLNNLKIALPDVLLLDIQMPDMSGIDLCQQIAKDYPSVKILALTNMDESFYVKQMIRNGAAGYLLKNTDQLTMINAIEEVMMGNQYLDKQIQKNLMDEMLLGKKRSAQQVVLTKRELEILGLIAKEFTNHEIAESLFISLRTVQTHRLNISHKLNAKNMVSLVKEAYKRGLI
ncbi:response regulator transcription factor [Pedobacter foliorum]|uniref:response regulator n=1 Tax=Pedobacter foliorum TaxID=2739058 RepID=UPI00156752E4|nr:response regulator transcription factor [Pedobacter foliorum]NRF41733.1 response regulator transcription factor [Pedobacter foliorum]